MHHLPWFRWKRKKDTQTAPEGAHREVAEHRVTATPVEPESAQDTTSSNPTASADGDAARSKRRRGSRGGRGRKRLTADGAADTGPAVTEQPRDKEREKPERSQRAERAADRRRQTQSGTQRRRQPPRRAPLPAAKRELLISVDVGEPRVAVLVDARVAEVYLVRP
jgi:hypothetical protein